MVKRIVTHTCKSVVFDISFLIATPLVEAARSFDPFTRLVPYAATQRLSVYSVGCLCVSLLLFYLSARAYTCVCLYEYVCMWLILQ